MVRRSEGSRPWSEHVQADLAVFLACPLAFIFSLDAAMEARTARCCVFAAGWPDRCRPLSVLDDAIVIFNQVLRRSYVQLLLSADNDGSALSKIRFCLVVYRKKF